MSTVHVDGGRLARLRRRVDAGSTMRTLSRSLILAAALIAPAAAFAACGESDSAAAPPAPRAAAPSGLEAVVAAGSRGAMSLVNDGRTIRVRGAGEMGARDRFRAGSITKPFVATVALQLVG